eukprot:244434_1
MLLTNKCKYKKCLLIDGYVRNMKRLWFSHYLLPKSITDSIYKFHSKLMSLISLQSPSQKLECWPPNCVYYHSRKEDKEYIILTPDIKDTDKCFKYDIANNQWIHFTEYPNGLKPRYHSLTMDEDNNILYLTHGTNSIFATFNMITNEWNVMSKSYEEGWKYNMPDCMHTPSVMINSELHIIGLPFRNTFHHRYNKSKKQFVTASTHHYISGHAVAYVNNKNMLMVLGGYYGSYPTDTILFTKCSGDNNSNCVWKEFPLKLPHGACPTCTVVFESVLIVYYKYSGDDDNSDSDDEDKRFLWILDLNENKYQWIKPLLSETKYPKFLNVTSLIATKANYLHFIDVRNGRYLKIHLSLFMPPKIYKKYVNVMQMNKN